MAWHGKAGREGALRWDIAEMPKIQIYMNINYVGF